MIQMKAICKSFERPGESRLDVLKAVDFEVDQGEFVAIVGPSGSGKTTLMNILGLLDRADAGDYQLLGRAVSSLAPRELARTRNRTIGFVFQQFHLLPRTTAAENVELPLVYSDAPRGAGAASPQKMAVDALCRVGLEDRLSHYPSELSGGQQQRVAIARALVNEPRVILADEPTGNLDHLAAEAVLELLRRLNQEHGKTIVMVTHDPHAASVARQTLHLDDGELRTEPTE